jgi:hypothetical protein
MYDVSLHNGMTGGKVKFLHRDPAMSYTLRGSAYHRENSCGVLRRVDATLENIVEDF